MDTASLASLVASLSTTMHVLSGYPLPDKAVEVHAIPQTELNAMVCDRPCNAQGAFLAGQGVFLAGHLDLSANVRHRAVLLHELVHEAQERTGAFADLPPCERYHRREAEAYGVEHAYLRRFGLSVEEFLSWQLSIERGGLSALRTTRIGETRRKLRRA